MGTKCTHSISSRGDHEGIITRGTNCTHSIPRGDDDGILPRAIRATKQLELVSKS